ncbi:hypothetical protein K3495_g2551 [Podosphaera aphanis]|nr:hypothetical protein K3495_g2551 [Podosphaera aphanis]
MAELKFNALSASLDSLQDNYFDDREIVAGNTLREAHDGQQNIPSNEDNCMLRSLKPIHLWQNFHLFALPSAETQCGSAEELVGIRFD